MCQLYWKTYAKIWCHVSIFSSVLQKFIITTIITICWCSGKSAFLHSPENKWSNNIASFATEKHLNMRYTVCTQYFTFTNNIFLSILEPISVRKDFLLTYVLCLQSQLAATKSFCNIFCVLIVVSDNFCDAKAHRTTTPLPELPMQMILTVHESSHSR